MGGGERRGESKTDVYPCPQPWGKVFNKGTRLNMDMYMYVSHVQSQDNGWMESETMGEYFW